MILALSALRIRNATLLLFSTATLDMADLRSVLIQIAQSSGVFVNIRALSRRTLSQRFPHLSAPDLAPHKIFALHLN
jgi:hypothetical protein